MSLHDKKLLEMRASKIARVEEADGIPVVIGRVETLCHKEMADLCELVRNELERSVGAVLDLTQAKVSSLIDNPFGPLVALLEWATREGKEVVIAANGLVADRIAKEPFKGPYKMTEDPMSAVKIFLSA